MHTYFTISYFEIHKRRRSGDVTLHATTLYYFTLGTVPSKRFLTTIFDLFEVDFDCAS